LHWRFGECSGLAPTEGSNGNEERCVAAEGNQLSRAEGGDASSKTMSVFPKKIRTEATSKKELWQVRDFTSRDSMGCSEDFSDGVVRRSAAGRVIDEAGGKREGMSVQENQRATALED